MNALELTHPFPTGQQSLAGLFQPRLQGGMLRTQEQEDRLLEEQKRQEAARRKRLLRQKCQVLEAQIAALQQELANEAEELQLLSKQSQAELNGTSHSREEIARSRQADRP